jgi:hypothetical protein
VKVKPIWRDPLIISTIMLAPVLFYAVVFLSIFP